ncbi:ParB/RepB/Spo0J family partition protein [Vibrio metschnikovii]|uniref:ParB/RepB/Spo0J family partition protein n=2 Tax=Bacteria TaxID=2 RepID=A0AAU6VJU3_UNCXX|nr:MULTISPECIES: ParB family protein [Vibrio]EEX38450.1 chromosome (plasmid) partitioning protein ParB [Vibrio metschnikovii CIP 69.14]EKO3573649.1 ParB/RepB/Spo0J family partition protein [Vibrio metschnikovii]EKO3580490.1 ParB/RepB/Spo0J family partition protein [Vibrio metschnikovii]EKO3601121.1 ParB/RepB/Spo0J family partition protein [Vibrio metschnikovii]EKO3618953.1 ParB/RepB/Spo0J family partition protein [Vibrio metschnikovii]
MAKKRGASPLGNTPGSAEAQAVAAKANIESLTRQLSSELTKAGENTAHYLQNIFGIESVGNSVAWQLESGAQAIFNEVTLSYEQVRDKTCVTFEVNGRDQSLLTKDSLSDLASLEFQQFYPAVGREIDGKIDVLDGSRRRAWVLLQQGHIKEFRILVTQDALSYADAKALAKQLQTAKEHNQREIGLQCKAIMDSGNYTQEDVAKITGISRPAVSKALKAASIDQALISLFPDVNLLSHPDYSVLDKVMKLIGKDKSELSDFIKEIQKITVNVQPEQTHDDVKNLLLSKIKSELKIAQNKQDKESASVTPLATFKSKGVYARKRVKGRNFSYEFGRLPNDIQRQLDKAIAEVLEAVDNS